MPSAQYAAYLRTYSATLSTIAFAKIEGSTDEVAALLKNMWNVSIGAEA